MSMLLISLPILIIIGALLLLIYQKLTNTMCNCTNRLDGKTVLVTGGTAGMGLEMSTEFARRGARVIIACPFKAEGIDAKHHITRNTNNLNVEFKFLDLASLKSVREFAADILKNEKRLDVLVNNAGLAIVEDYITKDGLNFIMQVNYYGTFLLTLLLLPLLKKTGNEKEPSRIVNTASSLHRYGIVELDNINKVGYYKFINTPYANSKLCVMLFTQELAFKLRDQNVIVTAVDPGYVGTGIFANKYKYFGFIIKYTFYFFFKTPWQGAQTAIFASLDDTVLKYSGIFFRECKIYQACSKAYNRKTAEILWEHSIKAVKLSEKELNAAGDFI